jgi:hypothetical protein
MAEPVDDELERLKRRRLLELQRRMQKENQAEEEPEPKEKTTEEVLSGYLVGRAWEVLRAARLQFPQVMPKVGLGGPPGCETPVPTGDAEGGGGHRRVDKGGEGEGEDRR